VSYLSERQVLASMTTSSSSGLEYGREGPTKGHLLAAFDEFSLNKRSTSLVADLLQNYDECRTSFPLSCAVGKDEVRPKEKLGKTRAFISVSFATYLQGSLVHLGLHESLYSFNRYHAARGKLIGAALCGVDTNTLHPILEWICSHKFRGFGDASGFDGSITRFMFFIPYLLKRRWFSRTAYTNTTQFWHFNVYNNTIYMRLVLPNGSRVWKVAGIPSGGHATLVDNTIMLEFAILYALARLWQEEGQVGDYSQFVLDFALCAFGDDSCNGTNVEFDKIWERLSVFMKELNISYKFEEEPTFLSHAIVNSGGYWKLQGNGKKYAASLSKKFCVPPYGISPLGYSYIRACALSSKALGTPEGVLLVEFLNYLEHYPVSGVPYLQSKEFGLVKNQRD
jgi:hypothetical protein